MNLTLLVVLVLAGIALVFVLQNVAAVEVTFLLWTLSISRALGCASDPVRFVH
jgi:uncharacterized integral membrane protein